MLYTCMMAWFDVTCRHASKAALFREFANTTLCLLDCFPKGGTAPVIIGIDSGTAGGHLLGYPAWLERDPRLSIRYSKAD